VLGDVTLGARVSVWYGAVLRGDTAPISVGEASNVQDGSIIHVDEGLPATIGARVGIGHRAVLHGCTVEDECLIGMGSILLNDVRIGTGSVVAAGAVVPEGLVVPPGSLVVGVPAAPGSTTSWRPSGIGPGTSRSREQVCDVNTGTTRHRAAPLAACPTGAACLP